MCTACGLVAKTGKTLRVLVQRKGLGQMRYWYLWVAEHCCMGEDTETRHWHLCSLVEHLPQTEPNKARECPLP